MITRRAVLLAALLIIFLTSTASADVWDEFLARVPGNANALVVANLEAIYKSPVALREGWEQKAGTQGVAAVGGMSSNFRHVLLAAQLQSNPLRSSWEIGVAQTRTPFSIEQLAKQELGAADNVSGQTVIRTARNTYLAELSPRTLGMMYPANRQETARWLKTARDGAKVQISEYLQAAAKKAETAPAIVMAIDAADMIDPNLVKAYLSGVQLAGGKRVDPESLAPFLAGMKGLVLTIRFENTLQGELRLDFDRPTGPYADILKPLLIDTLSHVGASFDELQDWQGRAAGNSYILSSRMSEKEVRRLLTLVQPPMPDLQGESTVKGDPRMVASKRYYGDVTGYVEDLREMQRKAKSHDQNAVWHESYAKKINQLPILNVDEELLQYGAKTSDALKALAMSLRGVALTSSVMQDLKTASASVSLPSYGYGYAGYSGYYGGGYYGGNYLQPGSVNYYNNYRSVKAAQDAVVAKGIKDREEIWDQIAKDTQDIRRKMVAKYNVEF